jgi:hypothetical protein
MANEFEIAWPWTKLVYELKMQCQDEWVSYGMSGKHIRILVLSKVILK